MRRPGAPIGQISRGFGYSLIELLIAVAITAVLLAIAVPGYHQFILKARRTDAIQALTAVLHAQERYRLQHAVYSDSLAKLSLPAEISRHYALSLSPDVGGKFMTGYTVAAHVRPDSPQVHDLQCLAMSIVVTGSAYVHKSSHPSCWPS